MGYGVSSLAVDAVRDLPLPRFFINAVHRDGDASITVAAEWQPIREKDSEEFDRYL
jgi:hypothetical protein